MTGTKVAETEGLWLPKNGPKEEFKVEPIEQYGLARPVTTTSLRPDLPSEIMISTPGASQAYGDGGVVSPSLAEITCIS